MSKIAVQTEETDTPREPYDPIFPKDSIGAVMDPHHMTFKEDSTVKEAVDMVRFLSNNRVPILYAYAVDNDYKLVGVLVMRDLLVAHDNDLIRDIMKRDVYAVNVHKKKEEVAKEALEKKFLAIPIVDNEYRLLGIVKFGDILDYAQEESSKDVQKIFGAGAEETAGSTIGFKIKKRLPWLKVNLLTAFMAAAVIGFFEDIVAKITALAIFLPVVAGQGGNTGAQSLAVVLRGLALDQIDMSHAKRVIYRETVAGLINGLLVGVVTSFAAWLWNGNPYLGIIIGIAMMINMVMATFFGAMIPLAMKKMGMDPAQCSNIILTTITDVLGFLILLGLAVIFQNHII